MVTPDPRNGTGLTYGFIFGNSTAFACGSPGSDGNVALFGSSPANNTPQGDFFNGEDTTFQSTLLEQNIPDLDAGRNTR